MLMPHAYSMGVAYTRALGELEGPKDICLLSKVNTLTAIDKPTDTCLPKDKPLGSPHGWLKIFGLPKYFHYDWVDYKW